eukprot:gene12982-13084_t
MTMQGSTRGWGSGLLGVAIFSGSMPATRLAVLGLSPLLLTALRALIAGVLAAAMLAGTRQRCPDRGQWQRVAPVAGGCVVGFPLLSALALQHMTSARSLVFIGLLPLSTAVFGVARGGERPSPAFWIFALTGAAAVAGFALLRGGDGTPLGDALMIAGIVLCGLGYAEGAVLTRDLGGWQAICWALVITLPLSALAVALVWPAAGVASVGWASWAGLAYISVFSMLIGFVFWYRGLSLGGIASVGQLQLLQPFMGLGLAALVLHETIAPAMVAVTLVVVGSVAGARRFA